MSETPKKRLTIRGLRSSPSIERTNEHGDVVDSVNLTRLRIKELSVKDETLGAESLKLTITMQPALGSEFAQQLTRDVSDTRNGLFRFAEYGSLPQLLSGETSLHHPGYHHTLNIKDVPEHVKPKTFTSLNVAYNTGWDVKKLGEEYPSARWKFYLSLNQSSAEQKRVGKQFLAELLNTCAERKISITAKTFDHTYDSCNLYTWHPRELERLLCELYPKYQSIFIVTPRFFQRRLEGDVPLEHIGLVQEPVGGLKGASHSVRMSLLGKELEKWSSFDKACKKVGIKPEAPWELLVA